DDRPVEAVSPGRTDRAALGPVGSEHEVVDEQLGTSVEEIDERLGATVGVERVGPVDPHPGQLAALPGKLVPAAGVLLLSREQSKTSGRVLFGCADRVNSHGRPLLTVAVPRCRRQAGSELGALFAAGSLSCVTVARR